MNDLKITQGSEQWNELRARCLSDLYWFAATVLNYADRVPLVPHAHQLLCRFIERKTGNALLDDAHYRKIELARGWGKTTLIIARTIQRICGDPNIAILIANEKEQTARDFLHEIKTQFEGNEFLRALFPEVIPPEFRDTTWSAGRIIVNRTSGRKEPTVSTIGVGGTVIGLHFDLILVDDAISRDAMENARAGSWQIMHQVNRWIHQLRPLLNPGYLPFPEILFIGTRWWHGDCYQHIEEHFGYGETPRYVALRLTLPGGVVQQMLTYRVGDLAVFRRPAIEDGRAAFPEKWTLDELAKMRVGDEALFACNFMLDPSNEVTSTFKESWLRTYSWLDDHRILFQSGEGAKRIVATDELDVLILVDPGGFSARATEDRARAAAVVVGSTPSSEHILLDVYSEKDTFLACCRKVVEFCSTYAPRKLVVELAGQQAAFIEVLRRELDAGGVHVLIEPVKPGVKAKEVRILGLEPLFQRGQVFIGTGANFHEFKTQYSQFPRSARFDVLDALSYLPQFVRRAPNKTMRSPSERHTAELEAYYRRRGIPQPS